MNQNRITIFAKYGIRKKLLDFEDDVHYIISNCQNGVRLKL